MPHPSGLNSSQLEEYLHHSYTRVDGLWFVLTEERYGFEAALALDEAVWRVLPKIQARLLQRQLGLAADAAGLSRALTAKLALDRYAFSLTPTPDGLGVQVTLTQCPWHDLIIKSDRAHLAERIGGVICGIEFPVFAREFNCSCTGTPDQRLCRNSGPCVFTFRLQMEMQPETRGQ